MSPKPLLPRFVQSSLSSAGSTQHMWELLAVQQFYHDMRGEGGSRVTSKLKQGAHIHQPTALPFPHAHALHSHITRAVEAMDSCFALTGAHHHGIAIGQ